MDDVERRKRLLLRRMGLLEQELSELESIPQDDYEDGTVIRFKLQPESARRPSGPFYNYAMIKIQGYWYLTGRQYSKKTWPEVMKWWSENRVKKVRIATGWAKLGQGVDLADDLSVPETQEA